MTKSRIDVQDGRHPRPSLGWAVIGMGRAGRSRVRVIEAHGDCELLARVSRRPELGDASLEEVWDNDAIDAVVIATENARHAALAQSALEAGKHVLVEYPLAHRAEEVRALAQLARDQGLVLHVEMIGLLTASHGATGRWLKDQDVKAMELHFQGGFYRWVEEEARAGHWGQLAVARLHALDDWCGPITLSGVEFETGVDGYELAVHLKGADGVDLRLFDSRRREQTRSRRLVFTGADGRHCTPPVVAPVGDLFGRDLQYCIDQITGVRSQGYVELSKVITMTALAEAISNRCRPQGSEPPSTAIDNGHENR